MTQLTIVLPDVAQAYIHEQIANGSYATVDDLITALILAENRRQDQQRLNALIRQGLNSGAPIAVTDEWWEKQREQLLQEPSTENR
jgi:antitoxin ParD1/3/4